jgi:hypothetical protein
VILSGDVIVSGDVILSGDVNLSGDVIVSGDVILSAAKDRFPRSPQPAQRPIDARALSSNFCFRSRS